MSTEQVIADLMKHAAATGDTELAFHLLALSFGKEYEDLGGPYRWDDDGPDVLEPDQDEA